MDPDSYFKKLIKREKKYIYFGEKPGYKSAKNSLTIALFSRVLLHMKK